MDIHACDSVNKGHNLNNGRVGLQNRPEFGRSIFVILPIIRVYIYQLNYRPECQQVADLCYFCIIMIRYP